MEFKTKITVTSILLGALCLSAILGTLFGQKFVTQRDAQQPLLASFQAADVTGLNLGNGTTLTKTASGWTLIVQGKTYPAAGERIDSYVKSLQSLLRERLVTQDSDVKALGLDQGFKTLKILGTGGKAVADLQIGGTNDLGDKTFVRFAGQKEVWQTDRGFARPLDQDFNAWADLTLFPGHKPDTLIRVTFAGKITAPDKTVYSAFDLVKSTKAGKSTWENTTTKATTDTMASWADQVASFRFAAFAAPNDPPPTEAPLGTLTVSWSDGTQNAVKIGPPDAQKRYRATEGTRDFWINDWSLTQLLYK